MIGNDAGELLEQFPIGSRVRVNDDVKMCRDKAGREGEVTAHHPADRYQAPIEVSFGLNDSLCFRTHELTLAVPEGTSTPASAGVLVEAAKAMVAAWDDDPDSEATCSARNALRQALSTTATPASDGGGKEWTVWDAEARMAREGDWRGVAYSIAHDILPLVPGGSGDHAYQERARMQIKAADRLVAAVAAATPDRFGEGYRAGVEASAKVADEARALIVNHHPDHPKRHHPHAQGYGNAAMNIATAIRALQPATGDEA